MFRLPQSGFLPKFEASGSIRIAKPLARALDLCQTGSRDPSHHAGETQTATDTRDVP
jgi:hypothetical protein